LNYIKQRYQKLLHIPAVTNPLALNMLVKQLDGMDLLEVAGWQLNGWLGAILSLKEDTTLYLDYNAE
jgi:hypothetical protein